MDNALLYLFLRKLRNYEEELFIRYIYPVVYEVESIEKLLHKKIEKNKNTDKTIREKLNIKTKVMCNELCITVNPYYFLKIRICKDTINYYLQKTAIREYNYIIADDIIPRIYAKIGDEDNNAFNITWDESILKHHYDPFTYNNRNYYTLHKYVDKINLIYEEIIKINNNSKYNEFLYYINLP